MIQQKSYESREHLQVTHEKMNLFEIHLLCHQLHSLHRSFSHRTSLLLLISALAFFNLLDLFEIQLAWQYQLLRHWI